MQGWKLQAVRLSGTGKNIGGQVKLLDTFPKERLKYYNSWTICCPGQAKIDTDGFILSKGTRRRKD